ncbi:hypothetical protein PsorP6_007663 [Peronosclerospora sorghi]|uniref:Uncharacterized protein n=1 Tax=Peronosclerospora sorghi TaxID=230839 RepID=A0ACC0W9H7_9STRA|nr:hypothetical protein PsorP6_007663 [Peronosclerospora sorghi]
MRHMELFAPSGSSSMLDNKIGKRNDEDKAQRRQRIIARAEKILLGKHCVGMLVGATCPVCLTGDVDTQLSKCGHLIHAKCIKRWIQSGTCCPVCREEVADVEEAFTSPAAAIMTKDRLTMSFEVAYSPEEEDNQTEDDSGYEWGWFEDFDEVDDVSDNTMSTNSSDMLISACSEIVTTSSSTSAQLLTTHREISSAFDMCRTFPPLHERYDTPYHLSKYSWMRVLPSHRHIAAKVQIRSFRIVEAQRTKAQHAEYLIEIQLDGRYFSRWRRFSEIYRFVSSLDPNQFRQSLMAWRPIETKSRWFNRLELSYLHERCRMLEKFAYLLLVECSNAHPLADLVEA